VPVRSTHSSRSKVALSGAAGAVLLGLVLSGCSTPAPGATAHPSTAATPAGAPAPTAPPAPTLKPDLSASENLAYFDMVSAGVLAANPAADGRVFVDALSRAGFDKTQMEVTFDSTAAGLAADSIQFALRFNGECLIGQTGPASDGYHSVVTALLGTGRCLVGATRQIDW
jgi:hypothetical protein